MKKEMTEVEKFDKERRVLKDELEDEKIKLDNDDFYDLNNFLDMLNSKRILLKEKYPEYENFRIEISEPFYHSRNTNKLLFFPIELKFYGLKIK